MTARDPRITTPRTLPDEEGRVVVPIIYKGLRSGPVDDVAMPPEDALDLAAALVAAAGRALARQVRRETLDVVPGVVWCGRHAAVHGDTLNPYDYPAGDHCADGDHRPVYAKDVPS